MTIFVVGVVVVFRNDFMSNKALNQDISKNK